MGRSTGGGGRPLPTVHIYRRPLRRTEGVLVAGALRMPCALGRSGVRRAGAKREGDGVTPAGTYRPQLVLYRADRFRRPQSGLPTRPLRETDGWCDDVRHRNYNRLVRLPFEAGHERMWRTDQLYDAVVIIDHNTTPTVRGRGSAIFLHVAKPKAGGRLSPTEGCVAMPRDRIRLVLRQLERCTRIVIH